MTDKIDPQAVFEKACRGKGLTPAESLALSQSLGISIPPTVEEVRTAITETIRMPQEVVKSKEELLTQNHAHIRAAVQEAIALGIFREEIFPSNSEHGRDVYILSSSHYQIGEYDPSKISQDIKESHAQLFHFMHLLNRRGVNSPLYVEGRVRGRKYSNPTINFSRQQGLDLKDPNVQEDLAQHPEKLIALMDANQCLAAQKKNSVPSFYAYSTYPSIHGAYSVSTDNQLSDFSKGSLTWFNKEFVPKYRTFEKLFMGNTTVNVQIPTAWQGNVPLLNIAGVWMYAEEVKRDCEQFFQFLQELDAINILRERDLSEFMRQTNSDVVPLGYVGAGHSLRIKNIVQYWATTHILTPISSIRRDSIRTEESVIDENSDCENRKLYKGLYKIACDRTPSYQNRD